MRGLKASARQKRLMVDNVDPNQGVATICNDVWQAKTNEYLEHLILGVITNLALNEHATTSKPFLIVGV